MDTPTPDDHDKNEFVPIFPEVAAIKGIKLTDAAVFGAVYFYSFKGIKTFCQSPETTGDKIGCSANTIRTALKKLCDYGLIEDLSPVRQNAPHDYKPLWLPKSGNQIEVTKNELPKSGNQDLVSRLPNSGNQKAKRLPKTGNNKKELKKSKNTTNSNELVADASAVLNNPAEFSVKQIKATKFTKAQYEQLLATEKVAKKPRKTLIRYIKQKLTPKPIAVEVYRSVAEQYPKQCLWDDIQDTIGDKQSDLERWREIIKAYIGIGWNDRNIVNMLKYFRDGKIPEPKNGTQNGATNGQFKQESNSRSDSARSAGYTLDEEPSINIYTGEIVPPGG